MNHVPERKKANPGRIGGGAAYRFHIAVNPFTCQFLPGGELIARPVFSRPACSRACQLLADCMRKTVSAHTQGHEAPAARQNTF